MRENKTLVFGNSSCQTPFLFVECYAKIPLFYFLDAALCSENSIKSLKNGQVVLFVIRVSCAGRGRSARPTLYANWPNASSITTSSSTLSRTTRFHRFSSRRSLSGRSLVSSGRRGKRPEGTRMPVFALVVAALHGRTA